MQAPWYTYVFAFLVALPVYILLGVGAFIVVKAVWSWIAVDPSQAPKKTARQASPGAGAQG